MRTVLGNGLTVILEEVRSAPVVAIQAWVKVGSADETEREAGLAHLHEHMLFKGTKTRGPGEIAKAVESRGGEINAWTSFDQTVYHLVLASRFFEEGLEVLADSVLHSVFDPGELAREIEVVVEEIKRAQDMPSRRVSRELFGLAYAEHPYRRPVIGTTESVRSFTRDHVLAFYERHYAPDNVTLVVVGDVEASAALTSIERAWGGPRRRHPGHVTRTREPVQESARARVLEDPVQEAHLQLAWHVPDVRSDDLAALDVLATVLGQGESSRLSHELKREKQLVNSVYAYAYTPRDPGLLVAGATTAPEKLLPAARSLLGELYRVRHEGITEEELRTAQHLMEAEAIWQRETVQGMARKLGFYETVAGSLEFEAAYYARVRATTAEDVRAVAERFARGERLNAVALLPRGAGVTADQLLALNAEVDDACKRTPKVKPASTPPAATLQTRRAGSRRREAGPHGIFREVLPSGARVLVKPEPAVPLVAVRAVHAGGLLRETAATSGLHQLLAASLGKGTRRRSAREVARTTDRLAATIAGNSGRNSFGARGDFLARHFDESFRLFAEVVNEPAFDPREVERLKQQQLHQIKAREDSPSGLAFDLFARTLYTAHPYRLEALGDPEVVAALTPEVLEARYRALYGPESLVLSIVGDIDPDHAFELCDELFGAPADRLREPAVPVAPEPQPDGPRTARRHVDKQQAHLVYGFLGLRVTDPRRFAAEVAAAVLAGQGGRLFVELRDKRSMAYSITAFNQEGLDPGFFAVYMGTSPEKLDAAQDGIRNELDKLRELPVPEDELSRARRYLVGSHAIGLQKNAARAAVIAFDEAYGVGADGFARYAGAIEAVTSEQVLAVARELLDPERGVLAIVSP